MSDTTKICGILFEHGENDLALCAGFSLSEEDERSIQDIFSKYDTDGWSVRGTREDIAKEIFHKKG